MSVSVSTTNKPLNPRAQDLSPKGYNRAALYSGKALDFDGVNDYVDCGTLDVTAYTGISISTNLKLANTTDNLRFVSLQHSDIDDLRIVQNGDTIFFTLDDGTAYSLETPTLTESEWNKLDMTFDGTTLKGYVNGVSIGSIAASFDFSTASGLLNLFKHSAASQYAEGAMAGFKIFNTALTAAQVADLYLNPEKIVPDGVASSALKLWLPMMEGAGTTAYDGSGNGNDGTISGATWVSGIGAPVAQTSVIDWNKYSITDTTDYATASSSTIASEGTIVFKHVPLANVGNTYFFSYGDALTGQSRSIRQYLGNYEFIGWGAPNVNDKATSEALEVGVIKNVAYTWDASGNVKVYINGSNVLDASLTLNTLTASKVGVNISPTHASLISNQIMFYAGLYDEVLTESQIQDIQDGTTNPESVSGLIHFWRNSNDWQDEVGSADLTENDNAGKVLFPQTLTTGRDLAGNIFANVRNPYALNLDGASWAEVHDNASIDLSDANASFETWVYHIDKGVVSQYIMNKFDGTTGVRVRTETGNNFGFYASDGTNNIADSGTYSLTANAWNHIVLTTDGTNFKRYINGALVDTDVAGTPLTTFANADSLYIGSEQTNVDFTESRIALPRIYNRALTATEVARNYNADRSKFGL
jgi:hypothetical protein